jgi:YggT family protein
VRTLLCYALTLFKFAVLGRIILSWVPMRPGSGLAPVGEFLYRVTEPVLGPLRRAIPPLRMGAMALDLSPIIVFIGIQLIGNQFLCDSVL